jgi:DNA polymerase-1
MATVKQSQPKDLNLDDAPAKQCDVFLVDGNNLAYRAFFALPEELQTVDGFPTNALLGMANMFMRMLMDYRPRTVLVAWDSRPTGRLEIAADYKAHRKPTPDLLKQQQPWFEPIVEAFGYRNLKVDGKEADDVIGTLARMAEDAGHRVCVVSTDRDAFQLASDAVCIMMTPRGVQDVVVYTPERIHQRYGIPPELVPDFIGLKGDTSDNIAGVPGIGDKTAAELLIQFGSMEGIYANLDAVSGEKRRQSLRAAADVAADSKRLATIDREIPLDVDFDSLVVEPPDRSGMKELFRKLEFRALLKRVDELEEAIPGAPAVPTAAAEVDWREAELADLRGLDHEVGLAVAGDRAAVCGGDGAVLLVSAPAGRVIEALRDRRVITHGLKHPALRIRRFFRRATPHSRRTSSTPGGRGTRSTTSPRRPGWPSRSGPTRRPPGSCAPPRRRDASTSRCTRAWPSAT